MVETRWGCWDLCCSSRINAAICWYIQSTFITSSCRLLTTSGKLQVSQVFLCAFTILMILYTISFVYCKKYNECFSSRSIQKISLLISPTDLTEKDKKDLRGLTEIWTRIAGFKVQSANHYTMRPITLCACAGIGYIWALQMCHWVLCTRLFCMDKFKFATIQIHSAIDTLCHSIRPLPINLQGSNLH